MIYADTEAHVASILLSSSAFKVVFIYHDATDRTALEALSNTSDGSLLVSFCSVHADAFRKGQSSHAHATALVIGRGPATITDSDDHSISHLVPTASHIVHRVSGSVDEIIRSLEGVLP